MDRKVSWIMWWWNTKNLCVHACISLCKSVCINRETALTGGVVLIEQVVPYLLSVLIGLLYVS